MFGRKPDASAAKKELQSNVALFLGCVLAVRAAPYLLHLLQKAD